MGATHFSGPVYSDAGFVGDIVVFTGITAVTDSSGGTASDTVAAITAGASYAQADMTAVKDAIASLTAKINAMIAAGS